MSKKLGVLVALVGLCALSLFLISCGSSSSRPSGLLYVLTQGNNGVGNNVTSFSIDLGGGGLSLINSNASTCTSSGLSCGPPLDIVLDPTGATAFVLNQGVPCQQAPAPSLTCVLDQNGVPTFSIPPTIYPYNIGSDGSFSAPGTPILLSHPTSNTDTEDDADLGIAMVRDTAGQFLFEINRGSNPNPTLGICPHAPDPTKEFDACPSISVFAMKPGSTTLTLSGNVCNGVPCPFRLSRIPTALSTITFTPQGGTPEELLFVTSNNDPVLHNDNTVSVYAVASDGTLTEQPGSPYATTTDPISVQAVNTNPAGQTEGGVFVYVGSQPTAAGALNIFQVCTIVNAVCTQTDVTNALLMPVTTPPPPATGANPVAMLVDPTNTFLYLVCEGSSQVFAYKITTTSGVLTALNPANLPTGTQPVAMALHPSVNASGEFLYTSNSGSSNISAYTLSTTTGSMTALSSPVISPSVPSGMAAR